MGVVLLNSGRFVRHVFCVSLSCFLISCSGSDNAVEPPKVNPNLPVGHRYPAWSIDGDSIYYYDVGVVSLTEGGGYRADPDSAGLRVIARSGGNGRMVFASRVSSYALSPDGSAVCLALSGNLFIGAFDGGNLNSSMFEQITSTGSSASPSWSPGDWIAFESEYEDPHGARAIWKVSPDGTGLTDISIHGNGEWLMPSWDATGSKIVYVRYVNDTIWPEIFAMNADGSSSKRLTRNDLIDLHPHFSPDGAHICYQSRMNGVDTIHVMNSNGSGDRVLATGVMPVWSPKGTEVAYVALTVNPKSSGTIWIVSVDGSKKAQVTRTRY
ncbi:MAG TPA: hypothetical protein VJS69_09550 [Candidatus Krumholzibacteria bacterium]|nr:hypothetical protein [Candidatus Krumholzibacteria bacterium]